MKRMQTWALLACFGFVVGIAGCGESSPQEAANKENNPPALDNEDSENDSSPEKTLAAIKAADASREYDQFCQFFTADARRVFAGGLWMSGRMLKGTINDPDYDDRRTEQDRTLVAAIDELMKKHGVDKKLDAKVHVPDPNPQIVQTKGEQPAESEISAQQKILKGIGKQMADPCLFVTDCILALRANGRNPDARMFENDSRLENLKIEDDRASAELVFTRGGREIRGDVRFRFVSGQWKFSIVPDVLYK